MICLEYPYYSGPATLLLRFVFSPARRTKPLDTAQRPFSPIGKMRIRAINEHRRDLQYFSPGLGDDKGLVPG